MTMSDTPKLTAFEYFECRPCIEPADKGHDVVSYREEETFEQAKANAKAEGFDFISYWTIYGITESGLAYAIGDFTDKEGAHTIMNAILAPMAQARDVIDASTVENTRTDLLKARAIEASNILEDFINQCSTPERI